jgi:signal transduction histidine kinase
MYQSATLKLTGWYIIILMSISLVFSVAIYEIGVHEVGVRLEKFQSGLLQNRTNTPVIMPSNDLRSEQTNEASRNIITNLIYINLIILSVGAASGYFFARRTLRPVEKAHEAQSRFTSDASHELRTPLSVMKAEIEVSLRDDTLTKQEYKEVLKSNLEEVEKLSKLSEMLLVLSKLDHKKLTKKRLDMVPLAKNAIKQFKQPKKRITLTGRMNAFVFGNEASIQQLMIILIDNALKYSPANSTVAIRVFEHNQTMSFEVTNAGIGINEQALPHIFTRFYRGDSSRTGGEQKGFGLGLSIAKQVADLHNGEITASSISDGDTVFTFSLQKISKT